MTVYHALTGICIYIVYICMCIYAIYINILYLWDIDIQKLTDFNVLLSVVNSILSLGSGNYLLDLDDFMHYR